MLYKMRRNERKVQVLQFIVDREGSSVTSSGIAKGLEMEIHNARMCLLRLHKQGLLYRKRGRLGCRFYTITEKGRSRLHYLKTLNFA